MLNIDQKITDFVDHIVTQTMPHVTSNNFYIFCFCLIIATFFGKKILHYKKNNYTNDEQKNMNINNTLYFALHFIFNMYCVVYTIDDVTHIINNPLSLLNVSNTLSFYVLLFHIYHIIISRGKISNSEWLHHIKVFVLCPLLWLNYTNLCNFGMFFMTGLPGGITYLLLCLKSFGIVSNETEKYISKHLNMWIRAPGCVITAYIIYLNYINNNFGEITTITKFSIWFAIVGTMWNGMYFASTMIESYKSLCIQNKIQLTKQN